MHLGHLAHGRDNNFNLIRMVAAAAVLVTHSFALVTGDETTEPLRAQLGITLGVIAVDIFFVSSGFLVTASLFKRQSVSAFVWARCLRIFPALFVMLIVTVFGIGLCSTRVSAAQYLSDPRTYQYLGRSCVLLFGVGDGLPGVFETNPWPGVINGSLWTMPFELWMYVLLAFAWLVLAVVPARRPRLMKRFAIGFALLATALLISSTAIVGVQHYPARLSGFFFQGATYYVLRQRIVISARVFWLLLALLMAASFQVALFHALYPCIIAYLIFFLAYVPRGFVRRFNQLGDYSYGFYIYAFPIQQSLIALCPGISVLQLIAAAGLLTLTAAVLSWHLIEKRALRLKEQPVELTSSAVSQVPDV